MSEWVNVYRFVEKNGKTYMYTDHGYFVSDNNDGSYREAPEDESKTLKDEMEELQKLSWCVSLKRR